MSISKDTLLIAGLNVTLYSLTDSEQTSRPITVLFLLHGRGGSAAQIEWVANQLLKEIADKGYDKRNEDLAVVTFDHRNHGARLVNLRANLGWKEFGDHNDRHAVDMYSIQVGTSRDVSTLIDFLPAFLYPNGERSIAHWVMSGISLGGHSTWITLRNEPRVRVGIPIIGGADYTSLMLERAKKSGVAFEPPAFPDSLKPVIEANDPVFAPYDASGPPNPFFGKKILALSGADDPIVPWAATETFFEKLNVGPDGVKKAIVAPGVGHQCTPEMVHALAEFVWDEVLTVAS